MKTILMDLCKVTMVAILTFVLAAAPAIAEQPKAPEQFTVTKEETAAIQNASDRINKANKAYEDAVKLAQKEVEAAQLAGQVVLLQIGDAHSKHMKDYKLVGPDAQGNAIFELAPAPEKLAEKGK